MENKKNFRLGTFMNIPSFRKFGRHLKKKVEKFQRNIPVILCFTLIKVQITDYFILLVVRTGMTG